MSSKLTERFDVQMKTFQEQQAIVRRMNVIDDQFFQKVAEDREVCEELLQILLDKPDLQIIESQTQRPLRNIHARSVILDALCRDSSGSLFNIEVQKDDKKRKHSKADEYQKRVRYNLASMDTTFAEKGMAFHQLPDLYAVFISQIDPFEKHKSTYHIRRSLEETDTTVYNGIHEIYVNTSVNDGTIIAELMQYFENSNGINPNFEKLCYRVEQFKESEKGVTSMASVFDEYAEEYAQEREKAAAVRLLKEGVPAEIIVKALPSLSIEDIKQLQHAELAEA